MYTVIVGLVGLFFCQNRVSQTHLGETNFIASGLRFLRYCLTLSGDRFPRPAFTFINRKDQSHVMPKSREIRLMENRRVAGLTPASTFSQLEQIAAGSGYLFKHAHTRSAVRMGRLRSPVV